jgi:hypothetical protein
MLDTLVAPDFETVASPGTAQLRLGVKDFTYHMILLHYTESGSDVSVANMKTAIEEIRVEIDSREQWKLSGAQLLAFNEHLGQGAGTAGYLPLFLAAPNLPGPAVAEALAWGTQNVGNLTVKVKIASGRTSPALTATVMGRVEARPLGKILQLDSSNLTPKASNTYFKLPSQEDNGRPLVAMLAETTAMTKVSYQIGQRFILQDVPIADLNVIYNAGERLKSVSGFSIVNFAMTGDVSKDPVPIFADGVPLINQTASLFMTSTSSFDALTVLLGEARV